MKRVLHHLSQRLISLYQKSPTRIKLLCTLLTGSFVLTAAVSSSSIPTIDLNIGPVAVSSEASNIALALSVEFPTVGAAYRNPTYNHATTYLGYWDSTACYQYKDPAVGAPISGEYFYRTGNVDSDRYCNTTGAGTGYSGNALNYIASSSIDLLRYALTGGNRVVDTTDTTVLERAYLYRAWNLHNSNFPSRRIPSDLEGKITPDFSGAGDVYAGSCNDRIWFGRGNSSAPCNAPGTSGNLNSTAIDPSSTSTVVVNSGATAPAGGTFLTTTYQVTNPLQTTTVSPTAGPITYQDVLVLNSFGTTTIAPPSGTSTAFVTNSYILNGSTSTTAPALPQPTVVTGTTSVPLSQRFFYGNFPVTAGIVLRSLTYGSAINVCTTTNSSTPSNLKGLLDGAGAITNVPTGQCGTGSYAGFGTRRSVSRPRVVVEPMQVVNVYGLHNTVPVYKSWTLVRHFDVYDAKDSYSVPGTKVVPMYARVKVCSGSEATSRTDLCTRQPSGNYKPTGELQKNATGARVSAFGYLLSGDKHGGVLRAPMGFLGPNYRDAAGTQFTNAQAEWDANTGIFFSDPRGVSPTFAYSGVVNYLNKFGTTGSTLGEYKTLDPVGELYFEAMRYYMGLAPTNSALSSATTSFYDGFPAYSTAAESPSTLAGWVDPLQNSCQRRNFILTIGDVNTHYDASLPGHGSAGSRSTSTQDPAVSELPLLGDPSKVFNAVTWTKLLSGFETDYSYSYIDSLGIAQTTAGNLNTVTGNATLQSSSTGSGGRSAHYWAGAAYWANTQPIRWDTKLGKSMKDVRVKSFTIDVDEGGNGLIDGNTRGIKPRNSSFYLAGKYGWFNDTNRDGNPYVSAGGLKNNEEWEEASNPNTPDGYVLASQAKKLIDGIRKFFSAATAEKGAISVSALSSQRFTSNDPNGDLFSPRFNPANWTGTIQRTSLRLNTGTGDVESQATTVWDSGSLLTVASTMLGSSGSFVVPADRKIFTMTRDSGSMAGLEFKAASKTSLDSSVLSALNTDPATSTADNKSSERINWLRGDRSNEIGASSGFLRTRSNIMGDVINSGPVYKQGIDSTAFGAGLASFASSVQSRTAVVYAGANDGMLHAFRATDGKELFAYIPRAVAPHLNKLTNPSYTHRPYVDGVSVVGEAQVGTSWKTVLASGMGGGAQGVFVLDVTNPEGFSTSNVMFEFTDSDDPDIGNILYQPRIVKIRMAGSGVPVYKWFVAVGSGYNNYQSDSNASTDGRQALFLLSLDKPASEAWTLNSNYYKIFVSDPVNTTSPNGMGNPGFATGSFGDATIFYTGDLHGNLWQFDLRSGLSSANAESSVKKSSGSPVPLAVAKDSASKRQPITVTPLVTPGLSSGYMVVFGTGKFMEPADSSTTGQQAAYGIWDNLSNSVSTYNISRSVLYGRTVDIASSVASGSQTFDFGSGSGSTYRGWYVDLPDSKERIAVEGALGPGYAALNSTIPEGECSGDGTGVSYCFNNIYGIISCTLKKSDVGLLSRPNIISIDDSLSDYSYSARNTTGRRNLTIRSTSMSTGSKVTDAGNVSTQNSKATDLNISVGRMSWREIRNFRD